MSTVPEVKCIAINPQRPEQLAIGANDIYARLYDRRMISPGNVGTVDAIRTSENRNNILFCWGVLYVAA